MNLLLVVKISFIVCLLVRIFISPKWSEWHHVSVGLLPGLDVGAHRGPVPVWRGDGDGQLSPRGQRWSAQPGASHSSRRHLLPSQPQRVTSNQYLLSHSNLKHISADTSSPPFLNLSEFYKGPQVLLQKVTLPSPFLDSKCVPTLSMITRAGQLFVILALAGRPRL